ncbi:hypothetical protein GFER_11310 [Geoalkalibacter ferrihydriticus DSM 17813]|uniref:Uncharacterized protein n=2 Tax=Geoalkalibacter ferrihydriticus TaxID=392333 RepID=A0A0C2DSB9_9BACT|nr:hypothetical protein [Geoalkalibacter ferrihydriticus]KIH76354.1 hypothetical protein GFER_11310 [Geoalkalibacter ferrihydriticus DSM 17813]
MKRGFKHSLFTALVLLGLMAVAACTLPTSEAKTAEPAVAAAQPTELRAARAPAPEPARDPYDVEIVPLTLAQCGQCHPTYFEAIRDEGGKHRFDCRECHEVFHAYSPVRQNWDDIMPDCASCHTLPHGEKLTDCLGCHINPHAPLYIPYAQTPVADVCADCHGGPAAELAQFPSLHTEQDCTLCHYDQHGYVPSCFECHGPHYQGQPLVSCAECHPVHKPLEMTFTATTGARTCEACHTTAYTDWEKTPSKHGQVNCTVCHTDHGLIPTCASCHGAPHSANLHERFPNCLTCHLNVHDLPVRRR